jgi:hypothetical protein
MSVSISHMNVSRCCFARIALQTWSCPNPVSTLAYTRINVRKRVVPEHVPNLFSKSFSRLSSLRVHQKSNVLPIPKPVNRKKRKEVKIRIYHNIWFSLGLSMTGLIFRDRPLGSHFFYGSTSNLRHEFAHAVNITRPEPHYSRLFLLALTLALL